MKTITFCPQCGGKLIPTKNKIKNCLDFLCYKGYLILQSDTDSIIIAHKDVLKEININETHT